MISLSLLSVEAEGKLAPVRSAFEDSLLGLVGVRRGLVCFGPLADLLLFLLFSLWFDEDVFCALVG